MCNEGGHVVDGDGGIIGLDEEAVEWGGEQCGRVEPWAVGQVTASIEPCAGHVLVAPHAVDGQGHIGQLGAVARGENLLGSPHAVDDNGEACVMGKLEVADKERFLCFQVGSAQAVHPGLADGEHLGVAGASLQQGNVARGDGLQGVPGMKAHRVPQSRLWVKVPRIDRDEGRGGIRTMGVEVEEHFSWQLLVVSC